MKPTIEDCRALVEQIKRHGGPRPHHRDLFARACHQLEALELEAGNGLGFPPLLLAIGKALAVVAAGLTIYGGARIVNQVSDATATMLDRLSVLAVVAASGYVGILLWRAARAA